MIDTPNDSSPQTPNALIAQAILRERLSAGLSLSALAARAGLAKSTLSQLEAGKGNPNVETLWAIATALGLPFSALFAEAAAPRALIRAQEGRALASDAAGFAAVLLDRCPPDRRRDLYRLALEPGARRAAAPHPPGTVEHALVATGKVRLGPEGAQEELGPGDYYRFAGDLPHLYAALDAPVLLFVVMEVTR
ncbi:helix-turn-helix domain-containing protein [Rhodobacter lacus]|uniref:Helix-turn-helix domain-containing protein n=1 Tax=Rhodobacter lacus TaxID=1641972 RepID=A0ABW5A9Q4_9RHOB